MADPADLEKGAWRRDEHTGIWTFDTRVVPPRRTLDLWRAFTTDNETPTDMIPLVGRSFTGRLAVIGGPGYSTFDLDAPPHVLVRNEAAVRHGGEDLVLVVSSDDGTTTIEQRGRSLLARPGDIAVVFMDVPFSLSHRDTRRVFGVRIRASEFPPGLRDRSPVLLDSAATPVVGIATSYMRWQPAQTTAFSASHGLVKDQFVALLRHALRDVLRPEVQSATLGDAIRAVVEAEIANPDLSAKLICARLGVSRTTLFEAVAAMGEMLGSLVRERRLLACLRDMRAGRLDTVAALAERWGFREQSTFTRAFRRRFGQPPTQWRRIVEDGATDRGPEA